MDDSKFEDIQKKTYKVDGRPKLSGYSFFYDDEEYLCVKNIAANESREEGKAVARHAAKVSHAPHHIGLHALGSREEVEQRYS